MQATILSGMINQRSNSYKINFFSMMKYSFCKAHFHALFEMYNILGYNELHHKQPVSTSASYNFEILGGAHS